jgi:hypothetical protein
MYGGISVSVCVYVCGGGGLYALLTVLGGVRFQLHSPVALSPRIYVPVPIAQETE